MKLLQIHVGFGILSNSMRLDKDVFRLNLGNLSEVYSEVAQRFKLLPKKLSKDEKAE